MINIKPFPLPVSPPSPLKFDTRALQAVMPQFTSSETLTGAGLDNLYIVQEEVVFHNSYMVRAINERDAMQKVLMTDSSKYFQKHVCSVPFSAVRVTSEEQIVKMMVDTEQPSMTMEQFMPRKQVWLKNCVTE
jgi:hypothetical protein